MLRTQDELLEKVKWAQSQGLGGFVALVFYMDYEHAKEVIDASAFRGKSMKETWKDRPQPYSRETVLKSLRERAERADQAWGKLKRGAVARSHVLQRLEGLAALLWLLGDEELEEQLLATCRQRTSPRPVLEELRRRHG